MVALRSAHLQVCTIAETQVSGAEVADLVIQKTPGSQVVDTAQIIDAANRARSLLCYLHILVYFPKPQTPKL
jgi:hypothetical protein